MRVNITDASPVLMVFIEEPRDVHFMYNGIHYITKYITDGYWLYWKDSGGHCYIKQFY